MTQHIGLASLVLAVALGGCESARFSSIGNTGSERLNATRPQSSRTFQPQIVPNSGDDLVDGGRAGVGAVSSAPLNDVQGNPLPPVVQPVTPLPQTSMPQQPVPQQPQVAAVAPSTPAATEAPKSTSAVGTWKVTDAGASCRLTLTSQSLFDIYRATPQGCSSPSLAKVNAWDNRGNEVVLFEPGGKIAARLFSQGNGQYSGQTARGATISMSR